MSTYRFIPFFIIALALNCPSNAQSTEDKVKNIREIFNRINATKQLSTKKLENEEYLDHMTDGGGELTGYYKDDTLYKIIDWVGISSGVIKDEYYFSEGKLVFVYEAQDRFVYNDSLKERDYSKQRTVFEGRYYFYNSRLIHVIKKGGPFSRGFDHSNEAIAGEFLDEARKYSSLLKTKGRRG